MFAFCYLFTLFSTHFHWRERVTMDRWLSGVKRKAVNESISTSEEGQNEKTKRKAHRK